mgnify:FL=1
MVNKHEAMTEYFKPIIEELTGEPLRFNFSSSDPEGVSLMTEYSDRKIKSYLHGGSEKAYGFAVIWVKPYSTDADDLNLDAMNFVQSFMDALEARNRAKDFPAFPATCEIHRIEVLQNMPGLAGINDQMNLARYQMHGRILYFESEDNDL